MIYFYLIIGWLLIGFVTVAVVDRVEKEKETDLIVRGSIVGIWPMAWVIGILWIVGWISSKLSR